MFLRNRYSTMPYKDPEVRKQRHKESSRRHYERNREEIIKKSGYRKRAGRIAFAEYKATLSCIKCGENHPATLDFHHHTPDPSNKKINELVANGYFARAMREIAEKCWVLCSNCHRKYHDWERKEKAISDFHSNLPVETDE